MKHMEDFMVGVHKGKFRLVLDSIAGRLGRR